MVRVTCGRTQPERTKMGIRGAKSQFKWDFRVVMTHIFYINALMLLIIHALTEITKLPDIQKKNNIPKFSRIFQSGTFSMCIRKARAIIVPNLRRIGYTVPEKHREGKLKFTEL